MTYFTIVSVYLQVVLEKGTDSVAFLVLNVRDSKSIKRRSEWNKGKGSWGGDGFSPVLGSECRSGGRKRSGSKVKSESLTETAIFLNSVMIRIMH